MDLSKQLESSGSWLFRHRIYLWLVLLPFFFVGLASASYLGHSHTINEFWQVCTMAISFSGLVLRMIIVVHAPYATSACGTRGQGAEILTTTGMYSAVRHPLCLANFIIIIGFATELHVWWSV